jgi:hypothetical protein
MSDEVSEVEIEQTVDAIMKTEVYGRLQNAKECYVTWKHKERSYRW